MANEVKEEIKQTIFNNTPGGKSFQSYYKYDFIKGAYGSATVSKDNNRNGENLLFFYGNENADNLENTLNLNGPHSIYNLNYDYSKMMYPKEVFNQVYDSLDGDIGLVQYCGFSQCHDDAIIDCAKSVQHIEEINGTQPPRIIYNFNGMYTSGYCNNYYPIVGEKHIPYVYLGYQEWDASKLNNINKFKEDRFLYITEPAEAGCPVYTVSYKGLSHDSVELFENMGKTGILSYTSGRYGDIKHLAENPFKRISLTKNENGDSFYHVQNINSIAEFKYLTKMEAKIAAGKLKDYEIPDWYNGFDRTINLVKLRKETKIDTLHSLDKYQLNTENSSAGNLLTNDLEAIIYNINNINSSIRNTDILNFSYKSSNFEGTSELPGALFRCENTVFGISYDALYKLGEGTELIASVSQSIQNMDLELAAEATSLSDEQSLQISKTVDYIMSNDIFSTIEFDNYSYYLPEIHNNKTGKLYASDIRSMISNGKLIGAAGENIYNDIEDASKTISSIEALQNDISNSKYLKGEVWNAVNNKLEGYKEIQNLRIQSNEKMQAAFEKALTLLDEYIGDDEYLDADELDSYKQDRQEALDNIASLTALINEMEDISITFKKKTIVIGRRYKYSAAERSQWQKEIELKNDEIENVIDPMIEKLEGLQEIMNRAIGIVNEAMGEIQSDYGNKVSEMFGGKSYNYEPVNELTSQDVKDINVAIPNVIPFFPVSKEDDFVKSQSKDPTENMPKNLTPSEQQDYLNDLSANYEPQISNKTVFDDVEYLDTDNNVINDKVSMPESKPFFSPEIKSMAENCLNSSNNTPIMSQEMLGDNYEQVIDYLDSTITTETDISKFTDQELAYKVYRGDFGNGDERRQKLGYKYDDIQRLVANGVGNIRNE